MKANVNKAIMQIAHTGREANWRAHLGLPVYAPSSANYSFLPYDVQAFTTEEVEQVIKDFGAATKRVIDAGFDGVEIHGANHYLIQQFFSPFSNKRNDKWGEPSAFPLAVAKEVARVVKEYAPKDFILGYRISPEEINPNNIGYTWHESTKLIDELTNQVDFDYIHLSLPRYNAKPNDSDKTFAELFKPLIGEDTKLIIVGNVMSQDAAEDALNYTDLVATGRAQIIDANFAKKIVNDHGDQVITEMSDEEEIEQKLTPGLREVFDQKTKMQNFSKMTQDLDYSKAIKIEE